MKQPTLSHEEAALQKAGSTLDMQREHLVEPSKKVGHENMKYIANY